MYTWGVARGEYKDSMASAPLPMPTARATGHS